MELYFTESFKRDYRKLPLEIQRLLDKQLISLLRDNQHPSLRTKKMQGHTDIWEGRISKNYRFTFKIKNNQYIIRRSGAHSILRNP